MSRSNSKVVLPFNGLPKEIAELPLAWQETYQRFCPLATYQEMVGLGWFKSNKSASTALTSDVDAPKAQYVGRQALYPRLELTLWAYRRANGRCRRGRRPDRKEHQGAGH